LDTVLRTPSSSDVAGVATADPKHNVIAKQTAGHMLVIILKSRRKNGIARICWSFEG
jgi:hypothetical protein